MMFYIWGLDEKVGILNVLFLLKGFENFFELIFLVFVKSQYISFYGSLISVFLIVRILKIDMIESGVSGCSWFSFLLGFCIVIFPLVDRIHTIELLVIDIQLMKDDIILSGKFYWFEFDFICDGNLAVFWFWLRLLLRLFRG